MYLHIVRLSERGGEFYPGIFRRSGVEETEDGSGFRCDEMLWLDGSACVCWSRETDEENGGGEVLNVMLDAAAIVL